MPETHTDTQNGKFAKDAKEYNDNKQELKDLEEAKKKAEKKYTEQAQKFVKEQARTKNSGMLFGAIALLILAGSITAAVLFSPYIALAIIVAIPAAIKSGKDLYKLYHSNRDAYLSELQTELSRLDNQIRAAKEKRMPADIGAYDPQPEYGGDQLETAEKEGEGPQSAESTVISDMSVPKKSESTRIDSDAIIRELTDIANSADTARKKHEHPGLVYKNYLSTTYPKAAEKKDLYEELAKVYKHFHSQIYNNTEPSAQAAVICREIVNKFAAEIRPHLRLLDYPLEIQLMGELSHADAEFQKQRNRRQIEHNYKDVYPVTTSEDQAVRLILSAKNLSDKNIINSRHENVVFYHTIRQDPKEVKRATKGTIICETEGADDKIKRFANLKDFFVARKEFLSQNSDKTKKFWRNLLCSTILYHSAQRSEERVFTVDSHVTGYVVHEIFYSFTQALADLSPEERKNVLEVFVAGSNLAVQRMQLYYGEELRQTGVLQFPDAEEIFPPEIQYNYATNPDEAFILREKKTSLDEDLQQPRTTVAVATGPDQTKTSSGNARQ